MARTTLTLEDDLQNRLTNVLKVTDRKLNPLVNELLEDWVGAQERVQRRAELRKLFRKALGTPSAADDVTSLERDWADVDQEAADIDVSL
jgi:hypothetical protein